MPVGDGAGAHVLHARATARRRSRRMSYGHDAAAVEEQQPAHRTAEVKLALPVLELRVPVHRLREREIAQQARQARRAARRPMARPRWRLRTARYLPFGVSISLERVGLDADLAREADGRRRELPIGAARGRDRRTADDFLEVCLPFGDAPHAHGEPPRRRPRLDRAVDVRRAAFSCAVVTSVICAVSEGSQHAGSSSTPISIRSSRSMARYPSSTRELQRTLLTKQS